MATKTETERLTRVEDNQADMAIKQTEMSGELSEVKADVKAIRETLDNLNGGKKAIIWFISTLLGIGVLVVGILNLVKGTKI